MDELDPIRQAFKHLWGKGAWDAVVGLFTIWRSAPKEILTDEIVRDYLRSVPKTFSNIKNLTNQFRLPAEQGLKALAQLYVLQAARGLILLRELGKRALAEFTAALAARIAATGVGETAASLLAKALVAAGIVGGLLLVATPFGDDGFPTTSAPSGSSASTLQRNSTPPATLSEVPGINPDFVTAMQRCDRALTDMIARREDFNRLTQRDWDACALKDVKPPDCPQSEDARGAALAARAAGDLTMTCNKDRSGRYVPAFLSTTLPSQLDDAFLRASLLGSAQSLASRFETAMATMERQRLEEQGGDDVSSLIQVKNLSIVPYPDAPSGIYQQPPPLGISGSVRYDYTRDNRSTNEEWAKDGFYRVHQRNQDVSDHFAVVPFAFDPASGWIPNPSLAGRPGGICRGYFRGEIGPSGPCLEDYLLKKK